MMAGKVFGLAMAVAALCWAPGAIACDPGDVSVTNVTPTITISSWDPFTTANQTATITLQVAKLSGAPANLDHVRLMLIDTDNNATPLRLGSRSTFPGPRYSITNGGVTVGNPFIGSPSASTPTATNSVSINLPNSNPVSQNLTLTITGNTAVEDFTSGLYSETLRYFVQCYKSNNQTLGSGIGGTTGPTLNLTVPALLTGITASSQTVNFQNFTDTTASLAITMKSTGTINANITSTNGNRMILAGVSSTNTPTNSQIAYSMTFDGQNVPAAGASLTGLARTKVTGGSKSLVLTLPSAPPSGKLAGTYNDTITITLSAGT